VLKASWPSSQSKLHSQYIQPYLTVSQRNKLPPRSILPRLGDAPPMPNDHNNPAPPLLPFLLHNPRHPFHSPRPRHQPIPLRIPRIPLASEGQQNSLAATLINRAIAAMATVEAFNTAAHYIWYWVGWKGRRRICIRFGGLVVG
jgi:hypothetical protein